ncbi:MAG: lytic transglycosylase domain-containing protein [Paracoccaceae bacterium]|jgi:soluble lytic murein transglycosylase-like protein
MQSVTRRAALGLTLLALAACGVRPRRAEAAGPAEVNRLISKYARLYDMPESLIHRVVRRESNYNPAARNGPYLGLMQILPQTARTMGYRGAPEGLLDAETNLKYAGKYLRGAWLVARGNEDRAVMWYAKGYYYEAKRLGLLEETGLVA